MNNPIKIGINIDQSEHILDTIKEWYNILLCTDKDFDKEVNLALPTSESDLNLLEQELNGSYLTLYGELLHILSCL